MLVEAVRAKDVALVRNVLTFAPRINPDNKIKTGEDVWSVLREMDKVHPNKTDIRTIQEMLEKQRSEIDDAQRRRAKDLEYDHQRQLEWENSGYFT